MITIYQCEICNDRFNSKTKCIRHERCCKASEDACSLAGELDAIGRDITPETAAEYLEKLEEFVVQARKACQGVLKGDNSCCIIET